MLIYKVVNNVDDMLSTDTSSVSGLLLAVFSPYLEWIAPGAQYVGSVLGLCLLYWGMRKKRAETKRIEKETEYLHKKMNDDGHDAD